MKRYMGNGDDKYLWKFVDENEMVFWTRTSTTTYLTDPTPIMPKRLVKSGTGCKIRVPIHPNSHIFNRRGIKTAGFASKSRDYFHTIGRHNYSSFVLVTAGELSVRYGMDCTVLKQGDMLIVPHDSTCDIAVKRTTVKIIWFNLDEQWKYFTDKFKSTCWKKFERYEILKSLSDAYKVEIYSPVQNVLILDNCAEAIAEVLRSEFCDGHRDTNSLIEKFLRKSGNLFFNTNTRKSAKELAIGVNELDQYCLKTRGIRFAKLLLKSRMSRAAELLGRNGKTCAETAASVGYSNQFSFSRAFKAYYGMSPQKFPENFSSKNTH